MNGQEPNEGPRYLGQIIAPCLLVVLGAVAYVNSLHGPFHFDDVSAIETNADIRRLWPPTWAAPSAQSPVAGRPVVGLTLAVNYALGGLGVRGYHVLNIAVHVLCALVLYGIVRRSLSGPKLGDRFGRDAPAIAFACALVWMVHPLQTECVNYIIQRTESVMALFYLLTLYCAIRGADSPRRAEWYGASVAACALGMLSKESMVTAPFVVALYDWALRVGPYGQVLRQRWKLYAGLAATWVIVAVIMLAGPRTGTVGFSLEVGAFQYALNQCLVVVHYLRLAVWPHPLIIDYGFPRVLTVYDAAPYAALLVALLTATAVALILRPPVGFLGAWVFVVLAPTSSVMPIVTEVGADRRMYLPLAGLVVLVVVTGYHVLRKAVEPRALAGGAPGRAAGGPVRWGGACLVAALVVPLLWTTMRRNTDYRDGISLWRAALQVVPDNWRAYVNLADALTASDRRDEAIQCLREALRVIPNADRARLSLGRELAAQGEFDEAILQLRRVVSARPDRPEAHFNLAGALDKAGRTDEAIPYYRQAVALKPEAALAHRNLARALEALGRAEEAKSHFLRAAELDPDAPRAMHELANTLVEQGDVSAAIDLYQQILQARPADPDVHHNLAVALGKVGRIGEAVWHFRAALNGRPEDPETLYAFAIALRMIGRVDEAVARLEHALRIVPDHAGAHRDLGAILQSRGRVDEAFEHYRQALAAEPESPGVHLNFGIALQAQGKRDEAADHFREALRIDPGFAQAHEALATTLVQAGRYVEAREHFEQAARLAPEWPAPLNDLAWILATHPDEAVRQPERAIQLAERAVRMTDDREAEIVDTLAAAYAAGGRFDAAVETARRAIALASAAQADELASQVRQRLELYEQGRPYLSPAPSP